MNINSIVSEKAREVAEAYIQQLLNEGGYITRSGWKEYKNWKAVRFYFPDIRIGDCEALDDKFDTVIGIIPDIGWFLAWSKSASDKEELYDYPEALADLAYMAGHERLRLNDNSRVIIDTLIDWAEEFQKLHKETDWDEVDYMETINHFYEKKSKEYYEPVTQECPSCFQKNLIKRNEEWNSDNTIIVCLTCGRLFEGKEVEQIIRPK